MTDMPVATRILPRAQAPASAERQVMLGYDARLLRRRRLTAEGGMAFLVDLPATISVEAGDCFVLDNNLHVQVVAAEEDVLEITGDLPRLAWHIGNRHTPCQIKADRLLIRQDHVLEAMLRQLGATVRATVAAFTPEGGAYGHGRTMGHEHGPAEAAFGHFHDHGDGQVHFHPATPAQPATPVLPFGHVLAKG